MLGQRSTPYADVAISAANRWLLATYNKPPPEHLAAYLTSSASAVSSAIR